MEVISPNGSPTPTIDQFNFNGLRVSPYLSAPSSPKRFGDYNNYLSAPTSPSRFYNDFDYFSPSASPSIPIGDGDDDDDDSGFAFFVSTESDTPSRSAEELFDGGKIKPLEKDHQLYESARSPLLSPNRPKRSALAQGKKAIVEAFSSPRSKKESRGRDPTPVVATAAATSEISVSRSGRRVSRSHSPYRISNWEEGESNKEDSSSSSISLSKSSSKSSRKWRLRDFLLFRSASEGRGTSKDPFRKYPVLYKKAGEDGKASPLRSSDNNTTTAATRLRRKEPVVSAHELHYARKKAESEDMKKRTFLPYKQGILGRLAGLGSNNR